LTRDPVADRTGSVVVSALARSGRGLVAELALKAERDGVPTDCVVDFDNIHTIPDATRPVITGSIRHRWRLPANDCETQQAPDSDIPGATARSSFATASSGVAISVASLPPRESLCRPVRGAEWVSRGHASGDAKNSIGRGAATLAGGGSRRWAAMIGGCVVLVRAGCVTR
jgi:hypothetical protein